VFISVIWRRLPQEIANTAILGFLFLLEDTKMGSKTQKTETIRHRKHAPNTINRKADRKVVRQNLNVLEKLKDEDRK
jgi:hypothetical protein